MISNDNPLDMSRIELLLREHFARTDKQLAENQKSNAEFRALLLEDMNRFKSEINSRFDSLQSQISIVQSDISGLKQDVSGLYHWDYWLLSIILVVFAMPQIVAGVKSLFSAITDGISSIVSLFRK